MSLATNILTPMVLRMTAVKGTLLPSEIPHWYPACRRTFQGTNAYYGINAFNVNQFRCSGNTKAMNMRHTDLFDALMADLLQGNRTECTLNISLEPLEETKPYAYAADHLDLVRSLAHEIHTYQEKIKSESQGSKTLHVIVRYASEMNDIAADEHGNIYNHYAGDPQSFIDSFRLVRTAFAKVAPTVRFAFSPAIRRDLKEDAIKAYWPGDEFVDIISCTWYIGDEIQFEEGVANFTAYILHRKDNGKSLGIDEFGGCETIDRDKPNETGRKNDHYLQRMSDVIQNLSDKGVQFSYATIFLQSKWGADATLGWA